MGEKKVVIKKGGGDPEGKSEILPEVKLISQKRLGV